MTSLVADYLNSNQTNGVIDFFQVDATSVGGDMLYLTNAETTDGVVLHNGLTYTSIPIAMSKPAMTTNGTLPQPQLSVAVTSNPLLRATIADFGDLAGCKVTHFSTLTKYLDADNFARNNLLDWSEDLGQATWTKTETTVTTNATTAPDGTLTADFVKDTTNNAQHYISKNTNNTVFTTQIGDVVNVSCYLKYAGVQYAMLYLNPSSNTATGGGPVIDLINGTVSVINNTSVVSNIQVVDAGGGWWRVSFNGFSGSASFSTLRVYLTATNSNSAPAYVGTGSNGVYLWGAQVTAPWYYARFNSVSTAQATYTPNSALNPVGTTGAATLTDNGTLSTHYVANDGVAGFLAGQTVSFHIYLKANTLTRAMVRFLASDALPTTGYANINLSTGTVISQSGLSSVAVHNAGSGWYRVVISAVTTADGYMQPSVFCLNTSNSNTYSGTGQSLYLWNGSMYSQTNVMSYQRTTTTHQPYEDPSAISPVDVFYISQLTDFGPETVTWKLVTPLDRPNVLIPRLQYLHDKVGNHIMAPGLSRVME